ncbi:MAG: DALR anticodon-binding domain-containing protein, partial [Anaerolineales bacterium]|nr:DALR anticodon-binding domain-containing protein [Anaerolineales bacterium]
RLAEERQIKYSNADVSLLVDDAELHLIRKMVQFPELIEQIAVKLEPHHLSHYSLELATSFHWFYKQCRVVSSIDEEEPVTKARLKLVEAAQIVLARCLSLMGMSAPDEM